MGWALNSVRVSLYETEEDTKKKEGDAKMEAEMGVMHPQSQNARNCGDARSEARDGFSLRVSTRSEPC